MDIGNNVEISDVSNSYVMAAVLSLSICFMLVVVILYSLCQKATSGQGEVNQCAEYDMYKYEPSSDGILDLEYENTFVGVSVPLLQDVSNI